MGSDNLNRVFIKAYGKGGASQPASVDATVEQEPLMVRFDTVTVAIPAPHMLAPPRQPARVAAMPAVNPTPSQHAQVVAAAIPPTSEPTQPLELTAWDETMMSLLFGGSTMVAPATSITAARRQPIRNQQVPTEPEASIEPAPKSTQAAGQMATPSAKNPASNVVIEIAQPRTHSEPPAGNHLVSSADQHTSTQSKGEGGIPAARPAKTDILEKISAMNQGGEIFRLDRPSYANTGSTSQEAPMQEQLEADESSQTAFDIELHRTMGAKPEVREAASVFAAAPSMPSTTDSVDHNRNRTMEKTKRREQGLRQARIKIFNPLWEVDRLEWPAICAELSRTIDEGSSAVVDNLLRACQEGLQVLAVTSPQSGEGTSTVACCLAMLAGKHGLNIALVDSNIENPSLSYQTNLDLEVDWNDAVAKRLPLEEIAVHSVDDQVTLVPLLERLNAPELNEQNVAMMLQELSQSFDLVIVDLGHMSAQRNLVRKLGELGVINAVVAVVDRRLSSPERIESCLRQIRQTGIASIGLVENFAA